MCRYVTNVYGYVTDVYGYVTNNINILISHI